MSTPTRRIGLVLVLLILAAPAWSEIEEHKELTGPFASGPEVTAACLDCHQDSADDFMKTTHWTWSSLQDIAGHGDMEFGKVNVINNFCIALSSNWPRCTSCHAGYGWKDDSFDFSKAENIDCLACHDGTGKYKKFPTGAGHPAYETKKWQKKDWPAADLVAAAQSVTSPSRQTCGACHFYGGGGDGVKHGDMDSSLKSPALTLDVHMSPEGQDMTCQECHTTSGHMVKGNAMVASPTGSNHFDCVDCHDADPHKKSMLNKHYKSIACQTCHVPTFARELPTKLYWDWSTAGKKLPVEKDEYGKPSYNNKKGNFVWGKNVVPTYAWYNGKSGTYVLGEKIDPEAMTDLNWPLGDKQDTDAKIYPFKVHAGRQAYDMGNNTLVIPKLFGPGGFWKTNDWNAAATLGMQTVGLEMDGDVGFAETRMFWRINHMVAPADQALKCKDCHSKTGDGRMNWAELGYTADPKKDKKQSRFAD